MTTQQFIFEEPLYKKVRLSENPHILSDLKKRLCIDGFNSDKGVDTTFKLDAPLFSTYDRSVSTEQITFTCQRYGDALYVQIHYDKNDGIIEKVGQYPSLADIQIAQIKQQLMLRNLIARRKWQLLPVFMMK